MTLDDFLAMDMPGEKDLTERLDCQTFTKCHDKMRAQHGIWIPELVPVFEKLDALRAT